MKLEKKTIENTNVVLEITKSELADVCAKEASEISKDFGDKDLELGLVINVLLAKFTADIIVELFDKGE